ncbi:lytic transglycosylase domain-containing protein [uncultured Rikenella sp.]|uniref:lytic transglycosylase domain-containing protein n=1 Tax=uncultured Rikenella sp. TaxID=368003 RepID=UPI002637883B|nr:lytic transglycosylase domain-containing protein [uncultured Rikenella sp.]
MQKFALLFSVVALAGSITIACAQQRQGGKPAPAAISSDIPDEAPPVFVPDLPREMTFAGERVPLEYSEVREALEREMTVTMFMHSRTLRTLRMTTRYFPVIEPILKKYGIPADFKYLCMAESGLDPNTVSPAGAAGLWQLMSSAAKDHGVETGSNVDLRFHVEIATEAACKYLRKAYQRYGSWTMAAASYNAGLAGVSKRIGIQGVDSYYDLFLPEETMRYVYRILSCKLLVENPQQYGFRLRKRDYLPAFENYRKITVSGQNIDWSALAARHGTNYKMLRILNPWIRSYEYANKAGTTYTVLIPTEGFRENGK